MKPCTPSALLLNALRQRVPNLSEKGLKPLLVLRKQLSNKEQVLPPALPVRKRLRLAVWVALLLTGAMGSLAQAATQACTPSVGYTNCVRVTAEAADQNFPLPANVTSVHAQAWGGGGGGGNLAYYSAQYGGGGGGYAAGTLAVAGGTVLSIRVGQGGRVNDTAGVYGGGGAGGSGQVTPKNAMGASGGGLSGVFVGTYSQSGAKIIAGGGGGSSPGADTGTPGGGGGGGLVGGTLGGNASGKGGTQTAGGAAATGGTCNQGAPTAGSALQGGKGGGTSQNQNEGGGGGGGGYFGGGGGLCQGSVPNGMGGGGSSYYGGSGVTGGTTTAGSNSTADNIGGNAANTASPLYRAGIGMGGDGSQAGGNGEVILQWVSPRVQVKKTTLAGTTGTNVFPFAHVGLQTLAGAVTNSSSLSVAGAGTSLGAMYVGAVLTAQTITEAPPVGFRTSSIECVDANAAGSGNSNPVASSNTAGVSSITIPAGAMRGGGGLAAAAVISCTFINEQMPTVAKAFTPATIVSGSNSVLTLTLRNPNSTAATLTSALVDTFPAGVTLADEFFGGTCTGTVGGTAGGDTLTYASGAPIPGGSPGSCTITANVTSFTAGVAVNTIEAGDLQTSNGNNAVAATASLTVTTARPTLLKAFAPSSIGVGGISVLTITLTNPNATEATLTSALTDSFPSGLTLADTTFGGTCTGTKTGAAGGGSVTYASGAKIPGGAPGSCTITANVKAAAIGTLTNTLNAAALKTNYGNNVAAASAVLTVTNKVTITLNKTLVDTLGGLFNLTITGGSPSDGTNSVNNVGDGGSTGPVSVTQGATITVAETAGTGTALANYTTTLSCVDGNGAAVATTGSGTSRTLTAPGAAATGNARNVTCTYTNTEVVVPVATPLLSCQSDANIFNTAYNGNPTGAPKASGFDNVWERGLSFGITAPTSWTAAAVATVNPGWNVLSVGSAAWIAHQASTAHVGNVDLWYRYVFELQPGVDPANFRLKMDLYADNSIGGLYVNGVLQTVAGVPGSNGYETVHYNAGTQYPVNLASNWQAGTNTIMLRTSSGAPALGFMAKATASGLCDTKVTVSKLTQGGVGGPFTITGLLPNANGFAGQNLTTTVVGTAVSAPTQTLTTPGALLDLQEDSPTGGYALSDISCTGLGAGGTATPNLTNADVGGIPARSVRLDAAATAAGSSIACTFTNRRPTITFTKELGGSRAAAGDQFTVAIRTGGVAGAVVNSTANSTTSGTAASVTAGSGTTGAYFATAGTAYTLTEAGASGATLANYNGLLSCVDTAGVQSTGLPTAVAFNPALGYAITPVAGAALSCTLTNTPAVRLSLQKALSGLGRVAASDQFTVAIRTGGAGGTIVNATTNSTTTGSGVNVAANTGTTGVLVGVPGTAYTFTEAMAPGSASTLAKYSQTLSCTNVGGTTNVSGWTSLPQTVTPVAGDNIACTVTNAPAALAVTGRVFLDHGLSGGTANDGVLNGGEVGQAGVTVRLTNCAATVYASSVTDGTGAYVFSVPGALSTGATLCVEQTNLSGRVSTGASVGSVALPTGSATPVGGTSYTYTRASTPDRIAFTWNGSGHAGLNFGDVNAGTFGANGSKNGQPGNSVVYAHTFTAGTAGTVGFEVSGAVASPSLSGWSEKIFADVGCTGTLQVGAAQLFPPAAAPQAVLPGQQVCVIVQELIPNTALSGYSNDATVQANFTYSNANPSLPTASYTLHDITNVGDSALELKKEVRNVTQGVLVFGINNQAKTGETLEYRITYTNNAPTPINSLVVSDATPVYTSFVSATVGATPASLTSCVKNTPVNPSPAPAVACATAQAASGTGPVNWRFTGVLNPGGTGDVLFQVKVD